MVSLKRDKKFQASFYGLNGKKMKLNTNDDVKLVLSQLSSDDFMVSKVEKKNAGVMLLYLIQPPHCSRTQPIRLTFGLVKQ